MNRSKRIKWLARGLGWAVLASARPVLGFDIVYATDRAPQLLACDTQLYRGRRAAAERCYAELSAETADLRIKAEAARGLGDLKSANAHFQAAAKAYPEDAALRARWGELFLATHQDNEAVKLFQESLELDADYLAAKLGLAKVSAGRFEQQARAWVGEVLEEAPDSIEAHLLLGRMALEEGTLGSAESALDQALEIAERDATPPLEIYALKASLDLLRGITDSPWTGRALEYNSEFGEVYATPAHFYVITRRYREAIELLRRAVAIQPDLYSAHAELGVNLLRENRVEEAQQHLAIAYRGDPYSARIVNTLRLIDSFDNYRVVTHPGEATSAADIILRLHQDEAAVLERYVLELVENSIRTFSERYRFDPAEPVVVELYPEHDDFAVRTSGLPGIGLLGVTFGYLVAMDSPSGRTDGDFHWGTTLWHEMAHVFTLEATNHLVPRWFSEGVSVFEEWSTGPLPGRHIPVVVWEAMKEDKLLPVTELDRGFIRPTYPSQIIVSYMQAGLICEYVAGRWGQSGLAEMLALFGAGRETGAAIQNALGIAPEELDADFRAFLQEEFGTVVESLDTWRRLNGDAHRAAERNDWEGAIDAAAEAIALYPQYVAEQSPYLVKARAHDALEQRNEAIETLSRYRGLGGHVPSALTQLAEWLDGAGRTGEALEVLGDVLLVAPLQESLHARLGDWLLDAHRPEQALREFEALLAMNPHDQAAAHLRLARAYLQLEDRDRGREHLLYALEIAPHYREAQQLLLEMLP